jgi:hypothetical protein
MYTKDNTPISLCQFIWDNHQNRRILLFGIGLCTIQFVIFKYLYPFPDFFSDSYSYLFAASAHLDVSIWPIGYSKFLSALHRVTYSDTVLIGFQYFFMQFAAIYLFFTLLYYFPLQRWAQNVMFAFLFINPLTLYLCNTVNSDALFGALSLLWFTELLWIVHRPRYYHLLVQAFLLFLCFTVRNNAYYYPVVTIFAIVLSRQSWPFKTIGITLPFLFLIPFIFYTREQAYKLTGTRQYSLFTGWQLANNALYIYDQVSVDSTTLPNFESRQLNRITINFFKHIRPLEYRSDLDAFEGNFFIRYQGSPLKQYIHHEYKSITELDKVKNWGKASSVFAPFGKTIILHHPFAYVRHFMWPNVRRYFLPPLLHLELYNYGGDEIDPIAQYWFHYPNPRVRCISHSLQGFLIIYESLFLLFNVYFIWQLYANSRYSTSVSIKDKYQASIWLSIVFLICNFGFSVFATVNILRYQFIPMFILLSFALILHSHLNLAKAQRIQTSKSIFEFKSDRPLNYQAKT